MARTSRVHNKRQPFDVYIGRPGPWGNPWAIGKNGTREQVIAKFREHVKANPALVARAKVELKGKVLGCWCGDNEACHGDVWIEAVESSEDAMPRTTVIDFETFYDSKGGYSLRKLSYPEYIHDERFKVHGLGVQREGEEPYMVWADDLPALLPTLKDDIVVVHNGYFDLAVLAWRYGWRPAYVIDTLSLANHALGSARDGNGKNDLGSLAERLELNVTKGDLSFSDGVRDLDADQRAVMEVYVKRDLLVTRGVMDKLLPEITNPDFELWLADHTLRIYTDKPLPVDMDRVKHTEALILKRLGERREAAGVASTVLASNKQFAEELTRRLEAGGLKLPMKVSPRTGKPAPALAKGDADFIALLESGVQPVIDLIRGRLVERSATTALDRVRKLERFNAMGGVRTHLVYYGAHTGRFAGAGGFNLQNLTSPDRATDPVDKEIAASIRESIVPGCTPLANDVCEPLAFVLVDAAQIEARVVAWLAGQESILEAFAKGHDIYSQFIGGVMNREVRKPTKADPKEYAAELTNWRNVGKESVLGLGFGMGVDKFQMRLRDPKSPAVSKMVEDGTLSKEVCGTIVKAYRHTYPDIVQLWYDLNRAFMGAKDGRTVKVGHVTFRKHAKNAVSVTLPSGRKLYYRNIRRQPYSGATEYTAADGARKATRQGDWEYVHGAGQRIYGGLLAENITQAVARDVIAEAILAAEQKGYEVVGHVHDEIQLRVPEKEGPAALAWLTAELSKSPAWAADLPLSAEGRVSKNLGK